MALPRTLIGTGVGALSGAVSGAATGGADQTLVQRAGRGILGGMAGATAGTAGHTALRYGRLRKAGYAKGMGTLDDAALGTRSMSEIRAGHKATQQGLADAKKVDAQKAQQVLKAEEGFGLTGSPKEIRNKYYALARKHHPDSGGDPEKFQALNEAYKKAIEAATASKKVPAAAPQNKSPLLLTTTKISSVSPSDIVKLASFYHELGLNSSSEAELLYAIDCLNSLAL